MQILDSRTQYRNCKYRIIYKAINKLIDKITNGNFSINANGELTNSLNGKVLTDSLFNEFFTSETLVEEFELA